MRRGANNVPLISGEEFILLEFNRLDVVIDVDEQLLLINDHRRKCRVGGIEHVLVLKKKVTPDQIDISMLNACQGIKELLNERVTEINVRVIHCIGIVDGFLSRNTSKMIVDAQSNHVLEGSSGS